MKAFVILKSTPSYPEARTTAEHAAKALGIRLDWRGLTPDDGIGLTFPETTCQANGFSPPCYTARGRFDDGEYISVEYSTPYAGFRKGLYIVIAASGNARSALVRRTLARVKKMFPDSYVKKSKVYIGCIH